MAKAKIFSELASAINNTNENQWDWVINRAEEIQDIAQQLQKLELVEIEN